MKNKFLSIFMIIALVLGSLPTSVLAARNSGSTIASIATYGGLGAMAAGIGCYFSNSFARFATPLLAGGLVSFLAGKLYHAYSQDTSGKKSKPQERKKAAVQQVGMITVRNTTIHVIQNNDINKLHVNAIVNAADTSLRCGGGIDGAIHKAAGKELFLYIQNMRSLDGVRCLTGGAVRTPSFELKNVGHIIHTVAPRLAKGSTSTLEQDDDLRLCYVRCLEVAHEYTIKSIAFPALGTGHCGWSIEKATDIALNTVIEWVKANPNKAPKDIIFVTYGKNGNRDYEVYLAKLQQFVPK